MRRLRRVARFSTDARGGKPAPGNYWTDDATGPIPTGDATSTVQSAAAGLGNQRRSTKAGLKLQRYGESGSIQPSDAKAKGK